MNINYLLYITPLMLCIIDNILFNYIPNIQYREKNFGNIYFDTIIMYVMLYVPYKMTKYKNNQQASTIISAIVTNLLFIFLGKLEYFDFVLSNSYTWKSSQIYTISSTIILYSLPIFYHYKEFYNRYTLNYIITSSILLIISIILYFTDKNIKYFHIHHWILGYNLLFLFNTNKIILQTLAGAALGCYTHGIISYGMDNIFS